MKMLDYIEVGKKKFKRLKRLKNSAGTAKSLKDQTQSNLDLQQVKLTLLQTVNKKRNFQKLIATVKTAIETKKKKELEYSRNCG